MVPLTPADGITYLFVSNSDNLGATLDLDLLAYFARTDKGFLMEVGGSWFPLCLLLSCCVTRLDLLLIACTGKPLLGWQASKPLFTCTPTAPLYRPQVCERQASDKKGGHLARRKADGRLM